MTLPRLPPVLLLLKALNLVLCIPLQVLLSPSLTISLSPATLFTIDNHFFIYLLNEFNLPMMLSCDCLPLLIFHTVGFNWFFLFCRWRWLHSHRFLFLRVGS